MTNYEAIKTMDKDELAEFLASIMDGQKCPASEKFCDGQRCCVDAILKMPISESQSHTPKENAWHVSIM